MKLVLLKKPLADFRKEMHPLELEQKELLHAFSRALEKMQLEKLRKKLNAGQ